MCVKLHYEDLNPNPILPHLTSTYTCRMTITPRVRGGILSQLLKTSKICTLVFSHHH